MHYYVKDVPDTAKASISIYDKDHKLVKTFSTDAKENHLKMDVSKGLNQFAWNLLYPESERIEGMILWNGVPGGILASPGNYFAKVRVGKDSAETGFVIRPDPNYKLTQADYEAKFGFLKMAQDKFNETQKALKDIRALRTQINDFMALQNKQSAAEIKPMADSILKHLVQVEETLHQTKAKSGQDVLNYPIRLNDKLSGLFDVVNSGQSPPSKQARDVYADLSGQIDIQLNRLKEIREKEIRQFNELIRQKALPVIGVK